MLVRFIQRIANSSVQDSLASEMRRRRFEIFRAHFDRLPKPVSILDVGGTMRFWQVMGLLPGDGLSITLLNVAPVPESRDGFISVEGDARSMPEFGDAQFDIVFSNSVIEHVGSFAQQGRMASEIQRIGRSYFVQTPNRYFPMEPHALFPGFQFLPLGLRVWMVRRFSMGWIGRIPDYEKAYARVASIELLSRRRLKRLFPNAEIRDERFAGLTKSFMVLGRWV